MLRLKGTLFDAGRQSPYFIEALLDEFHVDERPIIGSSEAIES